MQRTIDDCQVSARSILSIYSEIRLNRFRINQFYGSTGQDVRSLQISYLLPWQNSGFRFTRFIRSTILVPSDEFRCFSSGLTGFLFLYSNIFKSITNINQKVMFFHHKASLSRFSLFHFSFALIFRLLAYITRNDDSSVSF